MIETPKQIFYEEALNTILESDQVDAIVAYKHEAITRGLSYITLPPQINLGNPEFAIYYKKTSYTFSSNGGKIVYGEPVYLSVTIPDTSKNVNGASSFANYLIPSDNTGKLILEKQDLDYLKTLIIKGNKSKIPSSILILSKQ